MDGTIGDIDPDDVPLFYQTDDAAFRGLR